MAWFTLKRHGFGTVSVNYTLVIKPACLCLIGSTIWKKGCLVDMATRRAWASCISLVLLLIFLFIPIQAAEQWRSALYPIDWHPDMRDEAGRFLHDFSYAGYHAGERPLPHAPLESAENVIDVTE